MGRMQEMGRRIIGGENIESGTTENQQGEDGWLGRNDTDTEKERRSTSETEENATDPAGITATVTRK